MTNMRKIIAQRMIESRRTSAHVHCMYEVDFTRIVNLRNKQKIRIRAAPRRPPYLHAVLRARRRHRPAAMAHHQRLARRRQHPLPPQHQHGHRRRARLGTDRSRPQERRRPQFPRLAARHHRSRRARPRRRNSSPKMSKAQPSPSPIPANSARSSACPSSISRTPPSWASAESPSSPW